jgi:Integrase core domain
VRRWLAEGDWRACASVSRSKKLDGLSDWIADRFRRHAGNADVVRQELASEKGLVVSLRTVERATAPLRRELVAAARATLRFETQPGEQLQIDFGERRVEIGGVAVKVFFFVATLGYSRRLYVRAYGHERQDSWFDGLESAFRAFGGVPREVLLDNAKALILHHDPASREVVLHPRLHAFARHWEFRIRACAPFRFQCSPYYVNSAFWPITDNFERALKFARDETTESKLDKLEALVALTEAIAHLNQGLELITTLPRSPQRDANGLRLVHRRLRFQGFAGSEGAARRTRLVEAAWR